MSDVTQHDTSHDDHEHHEPHISEAQLWTIAGYMLALTAATFLSLVLQKHVWGPMTNMLFVFAVAMCKATLVVAFFMHYKYEKNWKYIVTLPALIVGIAAVFAFLPDIAIGTWPKMTWHP